MIEAAVKAGSTDPYDEDLHRRFVLWKDQSGKSIGGIAHMLGRSTALVSQYISQKYPGNLDEIEKDITSLLRREEDLDFVREPKSFAHTEASKLIWEVLLYCDKKQKMGAAVAPSGSGKTETCKAYKKENRASIFVTCDISKRRPGTVLQMILKHMGSASSGSSISSALDACVERLRDSNRLLIMDDAHFLTWEAYELVRKIHDCARIGVVYVGQEKLYDQMRGTIPGEKDRSMLYDQIYSRIAIKRDKLPVTKKDVKMIARSYYDFDAECLDYLYARAKGKGRYRTATNLIEVALEMNQQFSTPVGIPLLQEAERFLMING